MQRTKYSAEIIVNAVEEYLAGRGSIEAIAKRLGAGRSSVDQWVTNYEAMGKSVFYEGGNQRYPKELKEQAVNDYLSGKGSLSNICKSYKIKSPRTLRSWIKK